MILVQRFSALDISIISYKDFPIYVYVAHLMYFLLKGIFLPKKHEKFIA